jgi:SagB-type dehydrogenase family enzyme
MFRDKYPLAWMFHKNTGRWAFNLQAGPEAPSEEAHYKEYYSAPFVRLPEPRFPPTTLEASLSERLSCRRFGSAPLSSLQLATLLKAAYGIGGSLSLGDQEFLERPVPSGGGLYPLELYPLVRRVADIEPGIYHYAALPHGLEQLSAVDLPVKFLSDLFLGQPYAAEAPVIVVLAALVGRSLWKYGDRGYRYVLLEAGHVAQNLNLMASGMDLGSLNLGGFFDSELAGLLGLDLEEEVPLYGVAIGIPSTGSQTELRLPPD